MIEVVTLQSAHLFGDALAEQHRFRYRQFVVRGGWSVPHFNGMEYDQFDTPAAVYLLWRDHAGKVRGMVRLLPTTRPYMTQTLWPELAPEELPRAEEVWENTRFAVDRDLRASLRKRVTGELILGSLEFGLSRCIERYLLISPLWVLRGALASAGLPHRMLRQTEALGSWPVASAYVPVSERILSTVRERIGIHHTVLDDSRQIAQAAQADMREVKRRQLSAIRGIAQSLIYLRGEASAAALDEVAAAIGDAEKSVSDAYARLPSSAEEKGRAQDS